MVAASKRDDIFRLPPLTMAEAKVVNTIIQMRLVEDHETTPALKRKIKVLDKQISDVMDLLGKRVRHSDSYKYGSPGDRGTVVDAMTAEEFYERDWEDTDDFDERKRGTVYFRVEWDPGSDENGEYEGGPEWGYERDDLAVVES